MVKLFFETLKEQKTLSNSEKRKYVNEKVFVDIIFLFF